MSWLEIIHLRSFGRPPESLGARIRESLGTPGEHPDVALYRREGLDTDVAIHIHHHEAPREEGPSRVGLRLASELGTFGLVQHTLWKELR